MRHFLALLSGMLIAAPLCAVEKEGLIITLTAEEDEECSTGGGCLVIPRTVLNEAIEAYAKRAYLAGLAKCRT